MQCYRSPLPTPVKQLSNAKPCAMDFIDPLKTHRQVRLLPVKGVPSTKMHTHAFQYEKRHVCDRLWSKYYTVRATLVHTVNPQVSTLCAKN
ncbi:protein of unknown function [Acidithiobacillus ferrivorans]|uniref:Transposase n=1 Tax=Acidithiobacillus ferrivorans TaxID=160808 RepID=A0ABY1MLN4_9PROT|nr:protein of unknown function [Acidithiobacillus ferrivorans]